MKHYTRLTAKAELVKSNSEEFKAVASSLKDRYGFDLKPQMDLLYVRSCLVSAGEDVGVNDNDDIFTREEAWAARHTPVLKPFNWQHNEKDILGVIYTVQARDVNGDVLDINDDTPPDCDFDLWVEAAIFRLIHEDRAHEIEQRAQADQLYVSMEAWFDDYSYGLCDQSNGHLGKIVARNQNTSFLDKHLRAGGGAGVYRDPDTNQDMRIGRVLRSITFGGCGFVDRPANKRSKIEVAEPMLNSLAELDTQIEMLLQNVETQTEGILMNSQAGKIDRDELGATVEQALERREQAAAAKKEQEALVTRANQAEERNRELEAKIEELSQAETARTSEIETLNNTINQYNEIVDKLVQDQAAAGATSDTPAEIARIDAASDGEAAFRAKIAYIGNAVASLASRAARAQELETQLAEAEAVVREQEVRGLLGGVVSNETLEAFVTYAAKLDQDNYDQWRDEKELMVLEMTDAAGKYSEMSEKEEKAKKGKKEEKSNAFQALLERRRLEGGMANPDTMRNNPNEPSLINHPGDGSTDVNSGVNPGGLRTPRHKIAGSAGDNPVELLDNAQAEDGVSLASAQVGDDGEVVNAFRTLANLVVDVHEEEDSQGKGPDFDPVR